jgi:hypothetical protein
MTEADWLTGDDPTPMLISVRKHASGRKLRLFACGCCRQNHAFMALVGADAIVEAAEQWADGKAARGKLAGAFETLDLSPASPEFDRSRSAMELGFCSEDAYLAVTYTVAWATDEEPVTDQRLAHQLRDIFGNPFRPVTFPVSWRTDTTVTIARQMYESRNFSAMPILADALQDAGCDDEHILTHCRDTSLTHVRGCWVVDLVLGKA